MGHGTRCEPPKKSQLHGEQMYTAKREKEVKLQQFTKKVNKLHEHATRRAWEDQSDLKRIDANQRQRDRQHASTNQDMLMLRRCKLREKLAREEAELYAELQQPKHTPEEKRQAMRRRLEELRAERESARRDFAERMEDLRWRLSCDELRCAVTKHHELEVKEDRDAQLALNRQLADEERQQQALHHQVMLDDVKSFNDERRALSGGLKDAEKLRMEVLHKQQEYKERVKAEEEAEAARDAADLAARLAKMQAEEEEETKNQKIKDRKCRETLLQELGERRKQAEAERQRDLAVEREIIERDLADKERETQELKAKREAHSHGMATYLEYLREARREEVRAEEEVERLTAEQAQAMYQRQRETWLAEQKRRQCLLQEAIDIRKQQVMASMGRAKKERALDRAYQQQLAREHEQLEKEEQLRHQLLRAAEREHADDLRQQAEYLRRRQCEERAEAARQAAAGAAAETAYQQKLDQCIREYVCERPHPWRAEHKHLRVKEPLPSAKLMPAGPPSPTDQSDNDKCNACKLENPKCPPEKLVCDDNSRTGES